MKWTIQKLGAKARKSTYYIPELTVEEEGIGIKKALLNISTIESVHFDLDNKKVEVRHRGDLASIIKTIKGLGYQNISVRVKCGG